MKICPVCDRPAEDLVGQDDVLMCPRCAAAVEVEPSLRHLDAGSWKDSGSVPEEDRKIGLPGNYWKAGLAASLGAVSLALIWIVGASSGKRAPDPAFPRVSLPARDGVSEDAPPLPEPSPGEVPGSGGDAGEAPSRPPSAPRPPDSVGDGGFAEEVAPRRPPAPAAPSPRDRARETAQEAARRISRFSGPLGRAAGNVGKRLEEAAEVERLLAQAVLAAPDLPDLALTQGRLFASLGRLDEAFAAYGRAFAADGDQLEALVGQCWILATAHLVGDIEGDAYPRAAEAFRKRMADRHGTPALVPLWNPAADRLRKACECVARGEFEAARSQVEGLVRDPCPPWLAAEIPVLLDALADLARAGLRGPPPFHRGMQKGRETGPFEIDHRIWKRLAFSAARPRGGRSFPAAMPETVVPHAVALRIDAGLLTESGRHQEALAKLDLALAASPEDLFTRLDRARALARLGRKEEASREYGEATRRAVELGFPPAVTGEIASLRSR